jgi:nitroreductase
MEYAEVLRRRRMVRRFTDEAVPEEVRERILASAVRGPSAGFSQGWSFLVLDGPEQTGRFWTASGAETQAPDRWLEGMRRAALIVLPLSSKDAYLDRYAEPDKGWTDRDEDRWPVPYWHVDAGMAALLMLMTAVDEGLGGCFFGIPRTAIEPVRRAFGVPPEWAPVGAVAIGHPEPGAVSSTRRARKPLAEVVHRGGWGA